MKQLSGQQQPSVWYFVIPDLKPAVIKKDDSNGCSRWHHEKVSGRDSTALYYF